MYLFTKRQRAILVGMSSSATGSPSASSMKILLVEDSKVLAERLSEAIAQVAGVNLIGTTDTEGVAIAVAIKEDVDVIVLDLHLKQGTGFGVMRALATLQRKPTVIVLTNFGLPEYEKASLAFGAALFLDKARDFARLPELLAKIREEHATSQ
jgi:two-component system OmpR family response regulator